MELSEATELTNSLREFANVGAAAIIVLFLVLLLVITLIVGLFLRGYNQRANVQLAGDNEHEKFNRDLYLRLDKSIERMADVMETVGKTQVSIAETQATNTEHQAQTAQAVEQITLNLKTIGRDVQSWPKAATETADRLAEKFDTLEKLVVELPQKMDTSKCQEILDGLHGLKATMETFIAEVRGKITPAPVVLVELKEGETDGTL